MMFTNEQFTQVCALAKRCGQIILNADADRAGVSVKEGSGNFVTKYDKMVQAVIQEELARIAPGSHFIGEESDVNERCEEGVLFIVDPIDGTHNFLKGLKHSCVSIGVAVDGKRYAGAVYDPYRDELFSAMRGQGAFLNGAPIRVSDLPLEQALTFFGTCSYYPELNEASAAAYLKYLKLTADLRRTGSSTLDLCYVACGRADLFFELRLCPWDYAAASVIIEEAGGKVTNGEGGEVSLFEKSSVIGMNSVIRLEEI